MKILFVSSEAAPLVKVGGLADVAGSLPRALNDLGHDVRVILPQYGSIDTLSFRMTPALTDVKFSLLGESKAVAVDRAVNDGLSFYTVKNQEYFGSQDVYGVFDLDRFYFFSRAVCEILPHLTWQPDILHCHDWLTSLVVMWSKKTGYPFPTVFTIHNLAYQGFFDEHYMDLHDLRKDWSQIPAGAPRPPLSFMAQAVLWADIVNSVSETYAREITTPEYGVGLDALLRYREDSLTGIVNGLDTDFWNPQKDEYLPVNFDSGNLKKRALNKTALQKVAGLPVSGAIPLIGMVQRLDEQKGLDLVEPALEIILASTNAQVVILGRGRENYEDMLQRMAARFPRQVAVFIAFEEPLAHLIYGGCDIFLMPSHFEPCGLGQLIAMRYGALPLVRHTGGLVDTVPKFSPDLSRGNGFVFHDYSPDALVKAIQEATAAFSDKDRWRKAVERVSKLDFSWQVSAQKYEHLYRQLMTRPNSKLKDL